METKDRRSKQIKRTALLYNSIPSVFWSIINLTPISIYCFNYVNHVLIYWTLGASFLVYFLPNRFLDFFQLKLSRKTYKNLGILFIRKLAQEGDLVNHFIRNKYPEYKVVKNRKSIETYLTQTYHFERFHFQLLIFFLVITIFALWKAHYKWASVMMLTNIIFNVYPNLLQHYNRIKLKGLLR